MDFTEMFRPQSSRHRRDSSVNNNGNKTIVVDNHVNNLENAENNNNIINNNSNIVNNKDAIIAGVNCDSSSFVKNYAKKLNCDLDNEKLSSQVTSVIESLINEVFHISSSPSSPF